MDTEDLENRDEPANGTLSAETDLHNEAEELLFINWRLIVQIEREYQEQQEILREFEEELDELFSLIHSPEPSQNESPDPPEWPNL